MPRHLDMKKGRELHTPDPEVFASSQRKTAMSVPTAADAIQQSPSPLGFCFPAGGAR